MARLYLQEFNTPVDPIPTELLDGLALYEYDLRRQVERISSNMKTLTFQAWTRTLRI